MPLQTPAKTVSVNDGIDFLIETFQGSIDFLNDASNFAVGTATDTVLGVKDSAVEALQDLIDKLQEAKG